MSKELFSCPRRGHPLPSSDNCQDYWKRKPNLDRCCSYCGSLHPEDLENLAQAAVNTIGSGVEIRRSDKPYKLYIRRPGVSNASDGGIKFYMQHMTYENISENLTKAIEISNANFKRMIEGE